MNFINDRELALRFKNDAVPSKERLLYLLAFLVPMALVLSTYAINAMATEFSNKWDNIVDIFYVCTTIFGTILCYNTNKNGDDQEFIDRFISIGFPIFVRFFIIYLVILLLNYFIYIVLLEKELAEETTYVGLFYIAAFEITYYWRLNGSMKLASH